MTDPNMFREAFPSLRQEGGEHYKKHKIQPYTFITENELSFFQGNVIKYVVRYKDKNGVEDLKKIIHYCQLEIEQLTKDK
jgi:hypothetical protein